MTDDETTAVLREIRDLQKQQVELQQKSLANQELALSNQAAAIARQEENRKILATSRKWGRILLWVILALIAFYLLQPFIFLGVARGLR